MKISDYVIISDVDGTLLPKSGRMPKRDVDALERFVSKGGRFGLATGRSKELTEGFTKALPVNLPCILYNGGALYDFKEQKFIMCDFLPDSARRDIKIIKEDMPWLSLLIISENNYYHVDHEISFANFSEEHRKVFKNSDLESLTSPWYKVLFSLSPKEAVKFDAYTNSHSFPGIRFVHTNPVLAEMLPEHSTKGYALQRLIDLGYFEKKNIAAIGDYYNDREMVELAAVGSVTASAPDDLKAMADFVACSCEDGAVADLVEYLESIAD